jgi:hypothetical protein
MKANGVFLPIHSLRFFIRCLRFSHTGGYRMGLISQPQVADDRALIVLVGVDDAGLEVSIRMPQVRVCSLPNTLGCSSRDVVSHHDPTPRLP